MYPLRFDDYQYHSTRLIILATWFLLLLHRSISSPTNDDDNDNGVAHLMISFSLVAIVRKHKLPQEKHQEQLWPQEYLIVHDKPPRGWWLTGGGIEHEDATPVDGAMREVLEEAAPQLLPQLTSLHSKSKDSTLDVRTLPTMTHLISLEQRKGRIRFIFRGEWVDDSVADETSSLLKCPPGDEESIEARWTTWDEIQIFGRTKPVGNMAIAVPSLQDIPEPWLRGHEPLTFFGMLEHSFQKHGAIPGLPVRTTNYKEDNDDDMNGHATGAFFGGMGFSSNSTASLPNYGRRAALLTHLQCHLLVYNEVEQTFAVDSNTHMFPLSWVRDETEALGKLVADLIKEYVSKPEESTENNGHDIAGLLRIEYVKHNNGREATLTVFPFLRLRSVHNKAAKDDIGWVSIENLNDGLERRLAEAIIEDQSGKKYSPLDILAVPKKKAKSARKNANPIQT